MWNNLVKFLSKPITAKGIGKKQEQKPAPKPQPKKIPSNVSVPFPVPTPFPPQFNVNPNLPPSMQGGQGEIYRKAQEQFGGKPIPQQITTTGGQVGFTAEELSRLNPGGGSGGQQGGQTGTPTGDTGISGEVTEEPVNDILKQAQDYVTTVFDLLNQGNLDLSNPFALDEVLARNAAVQSISPYYAELYGRFRKAVDLDKLLGQGKAQRSLQELQQGGENYQSKLARLLQLGQEQTGEQFEGQGLFESGGRQRAQGLQRVTGQQDLQNYLQGQRRQEQGVREQEEGFLNRLLLQKQEKESQLASAQRTDVESAVQEAQRVAQSRQGIAALEGQPLTGENLPEYFKRRGTALSQFLPS